MKEDKNGGGDAEAAAFVSGVAAGFLSTFAGHPFEVIKTRLQSQIYPVPSRCSFKTD